MIFDDDGRPIETPHIIATREPVVSDAEYTDHPVAEGLPRTIRATLDGQEHFVPEDDQNWHYQAVLKWVKAGNEIKEAPSRPVPQSDADT